MTRILPDTNIWLRDTWMMRSPIGAALLFALEQVDARLVLPEVVEMEVAKHVVRMGLDANQQVEDAYRKIAMLVGRRDDYRLPTGQDYAAAIEDRFEELNDRLVRVPFTFDHAQGALRRVMDEDPPNAAKDQQFKDSAIWEAALEVATDAPVHFITRDKGFFEERNPSKGLAVVLKKQLAERGVEIYVHGGANAFLAAIQQELPAVDRAAVIKAVAVLIAPDLNRVVDKHEVVLGHMINADVQLFPTERRSVLAIDFRLWYQVELEDDSAAKMDVEGSCSYDLQNGEAADLKLEQITAYDEDGSRIPGIGAKYLHAGTTYIGRRELPHTLRRPLDF